MNCAFGKEKSLGSVQKSRDLQTTLTTAVKVQCLASISSQWEIFFHSSPQLLFVFTIKQQYSVLGLCTKWVKIYGTSVIPFPNRKCNHIPGNVFTNLFYCVTDSICFWSRRNFKRFQISKRLLKYLLNCCKCQTTLWVLKYYRFCLTFLFKCH